MSEQSSNIRNILLFVDFMPFNCIQVFDIANDLPILKYVMIFIVVIIRIDFKKRMENVSQEQITCSIATDNNIIIFDEDHWNDERKKIGTERCFEEVNHDQINLISQLEKQLKKTKQIWCKVDKIQKSENIKFPKHLPQLQNPHYILKEGYLEKKTDGFFFNWHKRYFVLTSEKLYSFENQFRERVISCINLKVLHAQVQNTKDGILLDFLGECQNLLFKGINKKEELEWKEILQSVINFNGKENKLMFKTMNKFIYESKDSLTEKEFLKNAQTGDILLFHTEHMGAKFQRALTNSDYDHVAMVVKYRKKQLMIFESNRMHGVTLYEWKQYINYFDLYGRVTIRKLNYIRKTDAQATLLNFVKKNLGKNYQMGLIKLLKFQSDFNWEDAKEDRGYFCSELVAKALKSIGLLDQKKSSGRYWPVDFSEKNNLGLKKGAFLGPEQSIILNKHIKNAV